METQYKIYTPSEIITLIKDNVEGVLKAYSKYGKEMLEHTLIIKNDIIYDQNKVDEVIEFTENQFIKSYKNMKFYINEI